MSELWDAAAAEDEFIRLTIGEKTYNATHLNSPLHHTMVRHVKTPAGAQFYGQPIGSIITRDLINKVNAERAAQGLKPPAGALTEGSHTAHIPSEVVPHPSVSHPAGGDVVLKGGKGGGINTPNVPGGKGPKGPGVPGGTGGAGGEPPKGPGGPQGALGSPDEPHNPNKVQIIKPTIKGPLEFEAGGAKYTAPSGSQIFRPAVAPHAMAYIMEPNGKLHAFNQNGEVTIPPLVDKLLTEKFGKGFKGDEKYLVDAFQNDGQHLLQDAQAGTELHADGEPQFKKLDNGDFQHVQLGSLHDAADLQPLVDSGELKVHTGASSKVAGQDIAAMDKPTFNKFVKKLPEGKQLEYIDKAGNSHILTQQNGRWVSDNGADIHPKALFFLRDKLNLTPSTEGEPGAKEPKAKSPKQEAKDFAAKLEGGSEAKPVEKAAKKAEKAAEPVKKAEPKAAEPKAEKTPEKAAEAPKAEVAPKAEEPKAAEEPPQFSDEYTGQVEPKKAEPKAEATTPAEEPKKAEPKAEATTPTEPPKPPAETPTAASADEPGGLKKGDPLTLEQVKAAKAGTHVNGKDGLGRYRKIGADHWRRVKNDGSPWVNNYHTATGKIDFKDAEIHQKGALFHSAPKAEAPKAEEPKSLKAGDLVTTAEHVDALPTGAVLHTIHHESQDTHSPITKQENGDFTHADGKKFLASQVKELAHPYASTNLQVKSLPGDAPAKVETKDLKPGDELQAHHAAELAVGSTVLRTETGGVAKRYEKTSDTNWKLDGAAFNVGNGYFTGSKVKTTLESLPSAGNGGGSDEPPTVAATEVPEAPKYPKGHEFDSKLELRDLKPGSSVLSTYTPNSGSGLHAQQDKFIKHEDGTFRKEGEFPMTHTVDQLYAAHANTSMKLTAAEDLHGGHYDAVHVGDGVDKAWLHDAKPGHAVTEMVDNGHGILNKPLRIVKQGDGTWKDENGNVLQASDLGPGTDHWNIRVASPEEAPAAAEAPAAPVADVAEPTIKADTLNPGDKIPSLEWLNAADHHTGVDYNKLNGEKTHYHKMDDGSEKWINDAGTALAPHHLGNSNSISNGKLTFAHQPHQHEGQEAPEAPAAVSAPEAAPEAPAVAEEAPTGPQVGDTLEPHHVPDLPIGSQVEVGQGVLLQRVGPYAWANAAEADNGGHGATLWPDQYVSALAAGGNMKLHALPGDEPHAPAAVEPVHQPEPATLPAPQDHIETVMHGLQEPTPKADLVPGDPITDSSVVYDLPVGQTINHEGDQSGETGGTWQHVEQNNWLHSETGLSEHSAGLADLVEQNPNANWTLGDKIDPSAAVGGGSASTVTTTDASVPSVPETAGKHVSELNVGDALTKEHLDQMPVGGKLTSTASPDAIYEKTGANKFGDGSHPIENFHQAAEQGLLHLHSLPNHDNPEYALNGNVVMISKAEAQEAITALENHPHFSPKYGLKKVPENAVAKLPDSFTEAAKLAFPDLKPKQALIAFLKKGIGQEHVAPAPAAGIGGDETAIDFKQHKLPGGKVTHTAAEVQHAITALENDKGVQVKSILAKANSPLSKLDQHELIGFIKDKGEQKQKYIDFLKSKLDSAGAGEAAPAAVSETTPAAPAAEEFFPHQQLLPEHIDQVPVGGFVYRANPNNSTYLFERLSHQGTWQVTDTSQPGWSTEVQNDFLKNLTTNSAGTEHAVRFGKPNVAEINSGTPAAEHALKHGDLVKTEHIAQLVKGDRVQVDAPAVDDWGHQWDGLTFENKGGDLWKAAATNDLLGLATLNLLAEQNTLRYVGPDSTDSAIGVGPSVTPSPTGAVPPQVGETLAYNQMPLLKQGEQFVHNSHTQHNYTAHGDNTFAHPLLNQPLGQAEFEHAANTGSLTFLGKPASATKQVESEEEMAADPIGQKYVFHKTDGSIGKYVKEGESLWVNQKNNYPHQSTQAFKTVIAQGKLDKVTEWPDGNAGAPDTHPAVQAAVQADPGSSLATNPSGLIPGKYSTQTGKAYMVVHSDGTGTFYAPSGASKPMTVEKVKSVAGKYSKYHGPATDADTSAAASVAAAKPKITSVEAIPNGQYFSSTGAGSTIYHVSGDQVEIMTAAGASEIKPLKSLKTKFLNGQILDKWGNSVLPKENYGTAFLYGAQSTIPALQHLRQELANLPKNEAELATYFTWFRNQHLKPVLGNVPMTVGTYLQTHGVWADMARLEKHWVAEHPMVPISNLARLEQIKKTLDGLLQNQKPLEPTGVMALFKWGSNGMAAPDTGHITNPQETFHNPKAGIDQIAANFAGGNIIGQHASGMQKYQKNEWLQAYKQGNFKKMYALEAQAAAKQGKGHAAGVLHPGHPLNTSTHQLSWDAAVPGEVPATVPVAGEWSAPHLMGQPELANYLLSAHMQNPTFLSSTERRQWVNAHINHIKDDADKLSLIAQARKLAGDAPLGEPPVWTDGVKPAKEYDQYFESTPFPTNMPSAAAKAWLLDNYHGNPEVKAAVDKYYDDTYPYNTAYAEAQKAAAPDGIPYHVAPTIASNYFQPKADEKAAQDLIPVFSLDNSIKLKQGAHSIYPLKDQHGNKYVFKPAPAGSKYRAEVEKLGNDLGQMFGFPSARSELTNWNGHYGVLQQRVDSATDLAGVQLHTLSDKQLGQIAQEHVLDWVLNNDDSKPDNLLMRHDGTIVGIDKGRAFRKFGQWKGLSGDSHANSNASLIYTDLYDGIRSGSISKEQAQAAYLAALKRAQKMQKTPKGMLEPLIDAGFLNRDGDHTKSDIPAADAKAKFFARQAKLVDDITAMWKKIFDQAGLGELPEPPARPLGEVHSGMNDPEWHNTVLEHNIHGKATLMVGDGLKGGYVHGWTSSNTDGTKNMHVDFKLTKKKLDEMLPILLSYQDPSQAGSTSPEAAVLPNNDTLWHNITEGAKTISAHAVDKEFNASRLALLEKAREDLLKDAMHIGTLTTHDGSIQMPSGTVIDAKHLPQYQLMLIHYANLLQKVDEAKANGVKTNKAEFSQFQPTPYSSSHEVFFNAGTGEKYIALSDNTYLHAHDGAVDKVPASALPADIKNGSTPGWVKTADAPNVQAAGPISVKLEKAKARAGSLVDDQLVLNGSTFPGGNDGKMFTVKAPGGVVIEIQDHDGYGTDWARQGNVHIFAKNVNDAGAADTAMDHALAALSELGVHLEPAEHADAEANYWKLMGHLFIDRNITKSDDAVKRKAYKDMRAGLDAKLDQFGLKHLPGAEAFERLTALSKAFPTRDEEVQFYRDLFTKAFGADAVQKVIQEEAYLPKFDHHDYHDVTKETGMPHWDRFDVNADKLNKYNFWLGHSVTTGENSIPGMLPSGALMSTEARLRQLGNYVNPNTGDSDQKNNSSGYVYTRLFPATQGFGHISFNAGKMLKRIATYTHKQDHFGNWNYMHEVPVDPEYYLQHPGEMSPHGRETQLYDQVPFWDAEAIHVSTESLRQKILTKLNEMGIKQMAGAKPEERVVLKSNLLALVNALKQFWGSK